MACRRCIGACIRATAGALAREKRSGGGNGSANEPVQGLRVANEDGAAIVVDDSP